MRRQKHTMTPLPKGERVRGEVHHYLAVKAPWEREGGKEGGMGHRHVVVSIPAHMTTMGPRKRQAVARRGRKTAGFVQPSR